MREARRQCWPWPGKSGGRGRWCGSQLCLAQCVCWITATSGSPHAAAAAASFVLVKRQACSVRPGTGKMRPTSFWQWQGKAKRSTYAAVGIGAFATKFLFDWLLVTQLFHRRWNLLSYWRPFGAISGIHGLGVEDRVFAGTMLFLAVPFVWLGLAMTVKRLRDAGQPSWLCGLFFVPLVNLLFFLTLSVLPSAATSPYESTPWPGPHFLDRWIPRSKAGSALASIAATTLFGLLFAWIGTRTAASYGWGLFLGLPFCLGLFAVLTYSYHGPRRTDECIAVALLPVAILSGVLLLVAIEGLICILMAAPLALTMSLLGGYLGTVIQAAYWGRRNAPAVLSMVMLLAPGMFGIEL